MFPEDEASLGVAREDLGEARDSELQTRNPGYGWGFSPHWELII